MKLRESEKLLLQDLKENLKIMKSTKFLVAYFLAACLNNDFYTNGLFYWTLFHISNPIAWYINDYFYYGRKSSSCPPLLRGRYFSTSYTS